MNNKRILITGGAGFLGSHLCRRLVSNQCEVLCLDNFFTGNKENIDNLMPFHNFELIRRDVTESFILEVDEVYHLACPASPIHYQKNPVKTIRTCVEGTLNMLELCRQTGAKLFIASTSEVYGDPEIHPQIEEYWGSVNPIGVRSCYDEGKRCAEALAINYSNQYNVPVRIARIFNTYGPNMHPNDGRVVSNFIVQALKDNPITIYGEGEQTRSFCYVDDLISGIIKLMESDYNLPVNLGNPNEFTIKQLAEKVVQLTDSKSILTKVELPKDDPKRRKPDISKAKSILNWEPKILLEEGLKETIKYFQFLQFYENI